MRLEDVVPSRGYLRLGTTIAKTPLCSMEPLRGVSVWEEATDTDPSVHVPSRMLARLSQIIDFFVFADFASVCRKTGLFPFLQSSSRIKGSTELPPVPAENLEAHENGGHLAAPHHGSLHSYDATGVATSLVSANKRWVKSD